MKGRGKLFNPGCVRVRLWHGKIIPGLPMAGVFLKDYLFGHLLGHLVLMANALRAAKAAPMP